MLKYHKNICFPLKYNQSLINFNNRLNTLSFKISQHCKERLNEKINNIEYFCQFIANLKLNSSNIIEYTVESDVIIKVLYRIKYNEYQDIILSISQNKNIITLFINNTSDKHFTLNKNNYASY